MEFKRRFFVAAACGILACSSALAEVSQVRIVKLYGLAFVPLMVMEDQKLVEKQAKAAGLGDVKGVFLTVSNPSSVNDSLLAGNADIGSNGPPSILTIWSRTKGTGNEIKGMAGTFTSPMWLNVYNPAIKNIRDFTEKDKIAVSSVKVSIPAIIMQMAAAKEWGKENYARLDAISVSMSHPDGLAALQSKRDISADFTSPPYMYRELEQPGVHTILNSDDVMGGKSSFSMLYSSTRFHDANPRTYKAVLAAFTEAIDFINKDKKAAAEIYLKISGDKSLSLAEVQKQLEDPNLVFTTSPYGVKKFADFMFDTGSIKNRPNSWKDVFFPEIYNVPGS